MMKTTVQYPDTMTLKDARSMFFERADLGADGGYSATWVRVETQPIAVYFPNTRCRVEAAKLHDLHHIATEYSTDWPGEAEIAGWELAGGCRWHGWAWLLDLGAFTVGLVLVPQRLWRAFTRGRRVKNLYHSGFAEERLGTMTVGELRARVGISDTRTRARASDVTAFALWAAVGVLWHTAIAAAGLAIAWRIARGTMPVRRSTK
jgi:hypothetical protein